MVDLDLDIIGEKKKTVKLFGREIPLRNVKVEKHLLNEFSVNEIEAVPMTNKENIDKASGMIADYLCEILEIDKEEAEKITIEQYRAIRQFMQRKEMYDQGFTDKEIDMIEKKAIKKQAAQIK